MGVVVSFINMKGGVGKTTLTREIGYHLAYNLEKKVLLIDIDPQINLTQSVFKIFGYAQSKKIAENNKREAKENEGNESKAKEKKYKITYASIQNIFNGNLSSENPTENLKKVIVKLDDVPLSIIPGEFGLDFITRNLSSSQLENGLYNFIEKNKIRENFDYILIDCPPTYSSYTIAALKTSDFYVIPVKPEAYSTLGVDMLEKVVKFLIREDIPYFKDKPLKNLGIIITNVKQNEKVGIEEIIHDLKTSKKFKRDGIKVFKNEFSYNSQLESRLDYLIDKSKAEKYSKPNLKKLTEEFIDKIERSESK